MGGVGWVEVARLDRVGWGGLDSEGWDGEVGWASVAGQDQTPVMY